MKKSELLKKKRNIILFQTAISLIFTGIAYLDIKDNYKERDSFIEDIKMIEPYVQDEDIEIIDKMIKKGDLRLRSDNISSVLFAIALNSGPIALSYLTVRELNKEYVEEKEKEMTL